MTQKGREDYLREICTLKDKIKLYERELATYDDAYKRFYDAFPKVASGYEQCVSRAVQRAMADAYVQWQEDNKL